MAGACRAARAGRAAVAARRCRRREGRPRQRASRCLASGFWPSNALLTISTSNLAPQPSEVSTTLCAGTRGRFERESHQVRGCPRLALAVSRGGVPSTDNGMPVRAGYRGASREARAGSEGPPTTCTALSSLFSFCSSSAALGMALSAEGSPGGAVRGPVARGDRFSAGTPWPRPRFRGHTLVTNGQTQAACRASAQTKQEHVAAAMATGAYPGGATALGQSLVPLVNRLQDIFAQVRFRSACLSSARSSSFFHHARTCISQQREQ